MLTEELTVIEVGYFRALPRGAYILFKRVMLATFILKQAIQA